MRYEEVLASRIAEYWHHLGHTQPIGISLYRSAGRCDSRQPVKRTPVGSKGSAIEFEP